GRPPGALPWRHAGLLGVFALWGATLAPVRGRWRPRVPLLPSARLLVVACPPPGGSGRSPAASTLGAAWVVFAAAAKAATLEPRPLQAASRRAYRNGARACGDARWYDPRARKAKGSAAWTKMIATIRCWKSGLPAGLWSRLRSSIGARPVMLTR